MANPRRRGLSRERQNSAAWVVSTTLGPGQKGVWWSTINAAGGVLQPLAVCRELQDTDKENTGRTDQRETHALHATPSRAMTSSAPFPSCTNNDKSAAQDVLADTISAKNGGWVASSCRSPPTPAPQRSSVPRQHWVFTAGIPGLFPSSVGCWSS